MLRMWTHGQSTEKLMLQESKGASLKRGVQNSWREFRRGDRWRRVLLHKARVACKKEHLSLPTKQ